MLIDVENDFREDVIFWEMYPQLQVAGPPGKLYKADKSRNKMTSSNIMWCIALCFDRSSKFYNLPEEGEENKVTMVFGDYASKPKYRETNTKTFNALKEFYVSSQTTKLERALIDAEEKMEERRIFLKETKYTMGVLDEKSGKYIGGTAELIDKMMTGTDKITINIQKAFDNVVKERAAAKDGKQKGGAESSLSDKEMI